MWVGLTANKKLFQFCYPRRDVSTIVKTMDPDIILFIDPLPVSHNLLSAPHVCVCSKLAYIANNMNPDQTAPKV